MMVIGLFGVLLLLALACKRQGDAYAEVEQDDEASEAEKWGALGKMGLVLLLFLAVAVAYLGAIGASLAGMAR